MEFFFFFKKDNPIFLAKDLNNYIIKRRYQMDKNQTEVFYIIAHQENAN